MRIEGISGSPMQAISNNMSAAKTKSASVETDAFKKALEKAKETKDDAGLRKACQQFEEMFVRMMMKNMRSTIVDGGLTDKSFARETYQEMLDNEMAKETVKGSGMGIAQSLYDQLIDTI